MKETEVDQGKGAEEAEEEQEVKEVDHGSVVGQSTVQRYLKTFLLLFFLLKPELLHVLNKMVVKSCVVLFEQQIIESYCFIVATVSF